jgi:hypothetical protein
MIRFPKDWISVSQAAASLFGPKRRADPFPIFARFKPIGGGGGGGDVNYVGKYRYKGEHVACLHIGYNVRCTVFFWLGYGLEDTGFESWQGKDFSSYS